MPVEGHITPNTTTGLSANGGHGGNAPIIPLLLAADALVPRRSDHLGFTLAVRRSILADKLPSGTRLYVGLFTIMPDRTGEGGTEISMPGYRRADIDTWMSVDVGAQVRRTNAITLLWPVFTEAAVLVGWGAWDSTSGGILRAFGWLRAESGDTITYPVGVGSPPGMPVGRIGLLF